MPAKGRTKTNRQTSHIDLDKQELSRKRNVANKIAHFCFKVDSYLLPIAALFVLWVVHLEPTSRSDGPGAVHSKSHTFAIAKWFDHVTSVPIIFAYFVLALGASDLKVDSDRQGLLWSIFFSCIAVGVTSLLDLLKQPEPLTLLAVFFSFGFGYLHLQAASTFICAPEPAFTSTSPPIGKTEAVLARMVLLADTVVLGGLIAIRVLAALGTGDIFSMPVGTMVGTGFIALIALRSSASACIHQLRHVLSVGFIISWSLFFSTIDFVADWNTGIIRTVALGGLVAHTLCFVTNPVLRIYQYKWGRFKRFVENYNPGEAYSTE